MSRNENVPVLNSKKVNYKKFWKENIIYKQNKEMSKNLFNTRPEAEK